MNDDALIRLVDGLEEQAAGSLTVEEIEAAAGGSVSAAMAAGILLVDYRTRLDGTSVRLCRLNRHHPLVAQLTGW